MIEKDNMHVHHSSERDDGLERGFQGTKIVQTQHRTDLPFILPPDHTIPVWKILSKVIKTDMTKVSLPVILSEPLNSLQRSVEIIDGWDLIEKIVKGKSPFNNSPEDTTEDSCYRLALCTVLELSHFIMMRQRLKKPFNPILGETFEYVTP